MEQLGSELITTTDSSNGRSDGSKAPKSNTATNVADRPQNNSLQENGAAAANGAAQENGALQQNGRSYDSDSEQEPRKPLNASEMSQDEEHSDAGAQTKNTSSQDKKEKAAARVPGGVTEADNESTPKPASFWLPHAEPEDFLEVVTD